MWRQWIWEVKINISQFSLWVWFWALATSQSEVHVFSISLSASSSPVEIVFGCILFEELLHKGTFKVVHHGVVNQPSQGLLGTPAAVKRLKGETALLHVAEL